VSDGSGSSRWEAFSAARRAVGATGCLSGFALAGGWASAEVAVAEAVAVALEAEDFGVMDEPVDHRGGDDLVAEDLAQPEKGLWLVTISEAQYFLFDLVAQGASLCIVVFGSGRSPLTSREA
jgi:hypothetical protein